MRQRIRRFGGESHHNGAAHPISDDLPERTEWNIPLLFAALQEHGLVFQPDIEAATADQILPMVKANLGIGFVSEAFLQEEVLGHSVWKLNLTERIPPRNVCLLMPAQCPSGSAARALEWELHRVAAEMDKYRDG